MYKRQQIQFLPVGENLYWTQRDREYLEDILRRDKQYFFGQVRLMMMMASYADVGIRQCILCAKTVAALLWIYYTNQAIYHLTLLHFLTLLHYLT